MGRWLIHAPNLGKGQARGTENSFAKDIFYQENSVQRACVLKSLVSISVLAPLQSSCTKQFSERVHV